MNPIEKAYKHVRELNEGNARWTMRIPVDRDRDSDCIIVDALRYAERRIADFDTALSASVAREKAYRETVVKQEQRIAGLEMEIRLADGLRKVVVNQRDRVVRPAWMPISTAPKDGTAILVCRYDYGVLMARWTAPIDFLTDTELEKLDESSAEAYGWFCADFVEGSRLDGCEAPTHWIALPQEPDWTDDSKDGDA